MKMSGECYSMKNLHAELNSPIKDNKVMETNGPQYKSSDNKNINQLLEYETMVSSAESKCSQLKGQLERIKQFYSNQTEVKTPAHPVPKSAKPKTETTVKETTAMNAARIIRQNSRAISTDTTGAALGTINNILAGITKTIQMPDFRPKEKPCEVQSICKMESEDEQLFGVDDVKINTKSKQSINIRLKSKTNTRRSRSKVASISSSTNFKKLKKPSVKVPDRRHSKSNENQVPKAVAPTINKKPKRIYVKPKLSVHDVHKKANIAPITVKTTARNPDLVEIYHNTAVKESKSSDSDITKKKCEKTIEKVEKQYELVPPLNIEENEPRHQPKGVVSCVYNNKNYTMPTISSRMKQVAKYYMSSFNIKTIPFCPATSTGPSHNIGINIQQVMSMVKSKQTVATKLSPTLAYNIGLAAGKWEENPLPFLVSSVSKTFYSHCPLSKSTVNYQHLQEIAKTIPQEIIEENEETEEPNSPETQSMIITGPSGDVKVTTRKQTVWTANSDEKKCTCITPKGVGFQQIVNKFNGTVSKPKINNTPIPTRVKEKKSEHVGGGETGVQQQQGFTPLQNKEKKLKEVLGKLHDEFEKMTKTYDDLVKKNEEGTATPETLKELEKLDQELNSKEEEIVMVMTLYKEVLALKQQVKNLKVRASKETVSVKSQPPKFNGLNNMATAGLLNKLLQRVHYFQTHYKRR